MNTWLEIDSFALAQNVRAIRNRVGDLPIWAVIKGNAFGHNLAISSEAFWRGGVDGFVVTHPKDAKWLTEQRYKLPVLVLFPLEDDMLPLALERGWQLTVTSLRYFERLQHFAKTHKRIVNVHYEVETGMHRTGILPEELEDILEKSTDYPFIKPFGLFTHLYDVNNADVSKRQIHIIQELQFRLQQKRIEVPPAHVLASDGLGLYGNINLFDAVRLGSALYGYCPHFQDTTPALTWKTRVIAVKTLKAGETIGYEGTYTAARTIQTATIPIGYFDGLDRRLSNHGYVLIRGKLCPIIGRISMNHTTVDVSGLLKKVEEGEEVVLLGRQEKALITLSNITEWTGIVDDEFVVRINQFIPYMKVK